jgi:hypothetical protein
MKRRCNSMSLYDAVCKQALISINYAVFAQDAYNLRYSLVVTCANQSVDLTSENNEHIWVKYGNGELQ